MFQSPARQFVCWRCVSRTSPPKCSIQPQRFRPGTGLGLNTRKSFATVHHPERPQEGQNGGLSAPASQLEQGRGGKLPPIRERLRAWEDKNPDETQTMLSDFAPLGHLSNVYTRPMNISTIQFDASLPLFDGDELGDLRSEDSRLRAGDMVELSSDGARRPILAVCLGTYNGFEHYYTISGKWFSGMGVKTLFVVHKFYSISELQPIIDALPSGDIPVEALNQLQDLGHGPSRAVGGKVLRKMLQFTQDAEAVYQANATTLDASSAFIGDPLRHRYLTLHEIADLLLPETLKRDSKFSPTALYAVHRALLQDEIFFRPLKQTGHRRSYLFEVSPLSEVRTIQKVEAMVREFVAFRSQPISASARPRNAATDPILSFVETAQKSIDASRKTRAWSPSGIIGPSEAETSVPTSWSATDIEILNFLELWASYQKFPNSSRFQSFGSIILRALERYEDARLGPSTGWTCLQEVGWIPPWEIPSRYQIRFPGLEIQRGGGFSRPYVNMLERHIGTDVFENDRKDWGDMTAYCIDAEATVDIDDAISLEPTENPDEFWIHVHVADPASRIQAETPLATYAELLPETLYLPGHFERMLPANIGRDYFSLGPDKPCLTFSGLVRSDGTLKTHTITPGTLRNVVYITGEDVAKSLNEPLTGEQGAGQSGPTVQIGNAMTPAFAKRKLTRSSDLTSKQAEELSMLSRLGKALQSKRLLKGGTPVFQARAEAKVSFKNAKWVAEKGSSTISGDPSILISYSERMPTDLVENAMRMACEIAAQWSCKRGIPIPFRSQPLAIKNKDLLTEFARDKFYPMLNAGTRPSDDQWRYFFSLLGGDEISTTAAAHFTLGADMYAKATSPLRRFADLIVHWQIEAAILEERRRGKSLVGNTEDHFLPFSRKHLDRLLPMLRLRERQARSLTRGDGADQWILQGLVRAWRFGEAPLPETFNFTVTHVAGRQAVLGRLDWFERPAVIDHKSLNGLSRTIDVRLGDVFEVKLQEVDIYRNLIIVDALGFVKRALPPTVPDHPSTITVAG